MFLLFLVSAITAPTPGPPKTSARAVVRILAPARASAQDWAVAERRTDRPMTDEQGRKRRLRTIDFE